MPRAKTTTHHRARPHRRLPPQRRAPTSPAQARAAPTVAKPSPTHHSSVELPRLLTVDEVADLLRTTRRAIYARIRRGSIPGVIRASRRLLIDGASLVDWLDQRRAVSLTNQGEQR